MGDDAVPVDIEAMDGGEELADDGWGGGIGWCNRSIDLANLVDEGVEG